jgi:toxin HigB-1
MIKSFQHEGLKIFFETGSKAGIIPDHAPKLSGQLLRLDIAGSVDDVNLPGWRLHALAGELAGYYAIKVSGNGRITFKFEGEDVVLVDYVDYH